MNKLDFINKSTGWPASASTFEFIQQQILLLQNISLLGGNLFILNGCVDTAGIISNGTVIINGEILDFVGGAVQTNVIIVENTTSRMFFDNQIKPYYKNRYATFGTASQQYAWGNFERNNPSNGVIKRVRLVEELAEELETNLNALANSYSSHTHNWDSITGKPNALVVYAGVKLIGDAGIAGTGADSIHTVPIPAQANTNYIVAGSMVGLQSDYNQDNDISWIVTDKQLSSFKVGIREYASVYQNLQFEFAIIKIS